MTAQEGIPHIKLFNSSSKVTSRSAIADKLRCNVGNLWQK